MTKPEPADKQAEYKCFFPHAFPEIKIRAAVERPPVSSWHPLVPAAVVADYDKLRATRPPPLHACSLPYLVETDNCLITAPHGSGKGFLGLLRVARHVTQWRRLPGAPNVVVITPSASRMEKLQRMLKSLPKPPYVLSVLGGPNCKKEEQTAKEGVQVVLGTPKRLLDMLTARSLHFFKTSYVIVDQAHLLDEPHLVQQTLEVAAHLTTKHLPPQFTMLADLYTPGVVAWELQWSYIIDRVDAWAKQKRRIVVVAAFEDCLPAYSKISQVCGCNVVTHNTNSKQRDTVVGCFFRGQFPVLVVENCLVQQIDAHPSITHLLNIDAPAAIAPYIERTKLPG